MKWLVCWFKGHDWTCNANEGIAATSEELKSHEGFWHYARMYCKRCNKMSNLNQI